MDPRFLVHNAHRDGPQALRKRDPHLRRLRANPLVWEDPLLDRLPSEQPGIYTLGGARQVGKTTLLKQWLARLLTQGVDPRRIVFLTGELIDDHHALHRMVSAELDGMPDSGLRYVLIDEIGYVTGWDRALKFLADAGALERTVVILTGSDLGLIREMRHLLPGRRGRSDEVDFHLHPLTWLEASRLRGLLHTNDVKWLTDEGATSPASAAAAGRIRTALLAYLTHGGFLTAINDVARDGRVAPATLATYSDWIRGDMSKRGKNETFLREVLGGVVKRLGTQFSWHALAKDLSIDHHATVADYVQLLERMDAAFIQPALREDRLAAAPKKARKVGFSDPFVFHAVRAWLAPVVDPWANQIEAAVADPELTAGLLEMVMTTHARRHFPTYYIKGRGEVDVAVVSKQRIHAIEVKWRRQLRAADCKEIARFPTGVVAADTSEARTVAGVRHEPLPRVLARLGLGLLPAGR